MKKTTASTLLEQDNNEKKANDSNTQKKSARVQAQQIIQHNKGGPATLLLSKYAFLFLYAFFHVCRARVPSSFFVIHLHRDFWPLICWLPVCANALYHNLHLENQFWFFSSLSPYLFVSFHSRAKKRSVKDDVIDCSRFLWSYNSHLVYYEQKTQIPFKQKNRFHSVNAARFFSLSYLPSK